MFNGCFFCVVGLPDDLVMKIKSDIRQNGGRIAGIQDKNTTHVIASEEEWRSKTDVLMKAQHRGLPVLDSKFISKSVATGKRLFDDDFLFPLETFGRKKSDHIDVTEQSNREDELNAGRSMEETKAKENTAGASSSGWRVARIFISSTFVDMHGERDHLTRFIFPELQDRCRKRRIHVTPVDLRWGVTEDETDVALEICLSEVENCRPFFIGMLGDRYGWVPNEYRVSSQNEKLDWLHTVSSGKSITHLEMLSGVLRNPEKSRPCFCFRDENFGEKVPAEFQRDFAPETDDAASRIQALKNEILETVPEFCLPNYSAEWIGVVDGKPMAGQLESFGNFILETMWKHICDEFPEISFEATDELIEARKFHENFVENHSRGFVGRGEILGQMENYRSDRSILPCVVVGEPGSGKTSLMATFVHNTSQRYSHDTIMIYHFVGAAPGSTDVRKMLTRICQEIYRSYQMKEEIIPEDYNELRDLFHEILTKIPTRRRLLIVIDAVNQLDETQRSNPIDWIPTTLPPGCRLILSTLRGKIYELLAKRERVEISVGELNLAEREEIVRKTLWEFRKKLSFSQMEQLLSKSDSHRPLYLVTACEELRVFGVFEELSDRILRMSETAPDLLGEVLERLEGDHGRVLVETSLSLLECSRGGLLESELLMLLGTENSQGKGGRVPLPMGIWTRLFNSMRVFLRPPGESGEGNLDFFHRQLAKAVRRRYLSDFQVEIEIHRKLAAYFQLECDPENDESFKSENSRAFSELVYHQYKGQLWEISAKTLGNLAFIERKCWLGLTFGLQADFLGISNDPAYLELKLNSSWKHVTSVIDEFSTFIQSRAHLLSKRSYLTFTMAMSYPDASLVAKAATSRWNSKLETRPYLRCTNKSQTPDPCILTIPAHKLVIRFSHVSVDEMYMCTASDDATVKIWDMKIYSEVPLHILDGHSTSVFCAKFSPVKSTDPTFRLASSSHDKTIKIWNPLTGSLITTIQESMPVLNISWCPSKNMIASSGNFGVRLHDFDSGNFGNLTTQKTNFTNWHSNGNDILICPASGGVESWNTTSRNRMHTFGEYPKGALNALVTKDDTIITSGETSDVHVWNYKTGLPLSTLSAHKDGVYGLGLNSDQSLLATASRDNLIIVWKSAGSGNWTQYAMLIGHTGTVYTCQFMGMDHVVTCSFDRLVKLWKVPKGEVNNSTNHTARILCAAIDEDGRHLVTGSRDKTLRLWNLKSGQMIRVLKGHTSNVKGCAFGPDGQILSGGRDQMLIEWTTRGDISKVFTGHTDQINACLYRRDSHSIFSGSEDGNLYVWDANLQDAVTTADEMRAKDQFSARGRGGRGRGGIEARGERGRGRGRGSIRMNRVAPEEIQVEEAVQVENEEAAKPVVKKMYAKQIKAHSKALTSLIMSRDGRWLISGGLDGMIKIWLVEREEKHDLTPVSRMSYRDSDEISSLGISPDGSMILAGMQTPDFVIQVWNARNSKLMTELREHTAAIHGCEFNHDGRYRVSGSTDATVLLSPFNRDGLASDRHGSDRDGSNDGLLSFVTDGRITATTMYSTKNETVVVVGDGSGKLYLLVPERQ